MKAHLSKIQHWPLASARSRPQAAAARPTVLPISARSPLGPKVAGPSQIGQSGQDRQVSHPGQVSQVMSGRWSVF